MEYISSDTNIWIDFATISQLTLPFQLPYTYIMYGDAIDDELLSPNLQELENYGLQRTELFEDEFYLAASYAVKFPKLSKYDRIALAIAKTRNIILMTGDKALRKAAQTEDVPLLGTLGILDQLLEGNYITLEQYRCYMINIQQHNGSNIRLPSKEIEQRLKNIPK